MPDATRLAHNFPGVQIEVDGIADMSHVVSVVSETICLVADPFDFFVKIGRCAECDPRGGNKHSPLGAVCVLRVPDRQGHFVI